METRSPNQNRTSSIITIEDYNITPTNRGSAGSFRSTSETVIIPAKSVICLIAALVTLFCASVGMSIFLLYNASTDIGKSTEITESNNDLLQGILKIVKNTSEEMMISFDMQAIHIESLKGKI
jgi:hypothetical protein